MASEDPLSTSVLYSCLTKQQAALAFFDAFFVRTSSLWTDTEGWNSELRSWWYPIGKNFGDLDAVIEELRYLARAELVR